jgi:putative hydrolase of the HAD superfamily
MQQINNIIFDLGGVIINLSYERTRLAFLELGVTDSSALYSKAQQSQFFDALDKGELSPAGFREEIRKHLAHSVTDEQIDAAWNAMLLDIPREKLELLAELKKKYRTFLLSNTNEIHLHSIFSYLQQTYSTPDLSQYFETCYYSCRMGMRKPDAEIFERVLRENNLSPAQTLFIDDSEQHIRTAEHLGIHAVLMDQNTPLHDVLRKAGVNID